MPTPMMDQTAAAENYVIIIRRIRERRIFGVHGPYSRTQADAIREVWESSWEYMRTNLEIDVERMDPFITPDEAVAGQSIYCKSNGVPNFTPSDGYCWSCNAHLGACIPIRMVNQHVTGCPVCNRSFCD